MVHPTRSKDLYTQDYNQCQADTLRDPKLQQGIQLLIIQATERCLQKEGMAARRKKNSVVPGPPPAAANRSFLSPRLDILLASSVFTVVFVDGPTKVRYVESTTQFHPSTSTGTTP